MNPVVPVSAAASPAGPATSGSAAAAHSNTANNVSVHNFVCFMLDRHFTRKGGERPSDRSDGSDGYRLNKVPPARIFPRPLLFSPSEVTATMKLLRPSTLPPPPLPAPS